MKGMTRFQVTALARLIASDMSKAQMKIDARSLEALVRRGLVRYCGTEGRRGEGNELRATQPLMGSTSQVTGDGWALLGDSDLLSREVDLHLRLERDRAKIQVAHLEVRAANLRRKARKWDDALTALDGRYL